MDQIDFSDYFKTKAQANDFSARLAAISQEIYKTDFNLDNILMEQFGLHKKDKFLSLLRDKGVNVSSASDLKEFFTKLQETISTIPVLSLTIAFEPKEKTLKAISEWFVMNAHTQVVFDIIVDPNIIGGATISYNGRHNDFSIKSTFDKVISSVMNPTPQAPTPEQNKQQEAANAQIGK